MTDGIVTGHAFATNPISYRPDRSSLRRAFRRFFRRCRLRRSSLRRSLHAIIPSHLHSEVQSKCELQRAVFFIVCDDEFHFAKPSQTAAQFALIPQGHI